MPLLDKAWGQKQPECLLDPAKLLRALQQRLHVDLASIFASTIRTIAQPTTRTTATTFANAVDQLGT